MQHRNRHYLYIMIASQLLICLIFALLALFLTNSYSRHTQSILRQGTLTTTEYRLRERVDGTIAHINTKQELTSTEVAKLINTTCDMIEAYDVSVSHRQLLQWSKKLSLMEYGDPIRFTLLNPSSGNITLYDSGDARDISTAYTVAELEKYISSCPVSNEISMGASTLYVYADQESINDVVKSHIYHVIHDSAYGENGYVWVNEVVNYNGGDDYAIRVIHPNLKSTEGTYLSTNMEDIQGNLPYLAELDGINKDGEIFHTYYFKNKSDDKIAEKASYAKLYKPYNWIIATGEPLEDIFAYSDKLMAYSDKIWHRTLLLILLAILLFFAIDISFIIISNKRYNEEIDTYVDIETKVDPLTGAFSRKASETMLPSAFRKYQDAHDLTIVMMIDLDNFKEINDTYGHDAGDTVLNRISQEIISTIDPTDCLFRWGGDEFILLCTGDTAKNHHEIADNLLRCISSLTFDVPSAATTVSISIGISSFHPEDTDYKQSLKRADQALYHSKQSGKNQYAIWDDIRKKASEEQHEDTCHHTNFHTT